MFNEFDKNKITNLTRAGADLNDALRQLSLAAEAAIGAKYNQLRGAPGGAVGSVQDGGGDGYFCRYQNGAIYYHPQIGAFWVFGAIYQKYMELGAQAGFLGYPHTDETGTPDGVGRYNHFQGGSIYWTPQTGAHEVHGLIRERWAKLGWERSYLGYPISDEGENGPGGRISRFQKGAIMWHPQTGVKDVKSVKFD